MELKVNLTKAQMVEVYEAVLLDFCRDEILTRLHEGNYGDDLKAKRIPFPSEAEIEEASEFMRDDLDDYIYWTDAAERALDFVLDKRPKPEPKEPPKDLLNDTLKLIGLETHTYFIIDDQEFKDQILSIDSFGDVFAVDDEYVNDFDLQQEWCDHEHEYLTLGRILTQYPDKVRLWGAAQ